MSRGTTSYTFTHSRTFNFGSRHKKVFSVPLPYTCRFYSTNHQGEVHIPLRTIQEFTEFEKKMLEHLLLCIYTK